MELKTMKVGSREYPITGYITTRRTGTLPLMDIPMMSDYTWHLSCLKSRLENSEVYRTVLGEDVDAVIAELRETLARYDSHAEVVA